MKAVDEICCRHEFLARNVTEDRHTMQFFARNVAEGRHNEICRPQCWKR